MTMIIRPRNRTRALQIIEAMAKERGKRPIDVLDEFSRYQKNGECQHFWPDQNQACQLILDQQVEEYSPYLGAL